MSRLRYTWFDWANAKIDLATQTEGILPEVSLPPGTQIAYLQSVQFSDDEVPAGAIDGVNKVFTWVHAPNPASSLMFHLNGVKQTAGGDFSLAGAVTTMTAAPPVGSTLNGSYRY